MEPAKAGRPKASLSVLYQRWLGEETATAGLTTWRQHAITIILIVVAVMGLPAWGSVILNALLKEQITLPIVLYPIVYFSLLALALRPQLDHRIRIWGFLALGYANGYASLARLGLLGSGRLYLLVLPLFATVLVGTRAGLVAVGLSLSTYTLFALHASTADASLWFEAGTAFTVFVFSTVLLLGRFCAFLMYTLAREREARMAQEEAQQQLQAYSRTLEAKVLQRTAALNQAKQRAEAISQRLEAELRFAGQVQAGFMAADLPEIPGWECAAALVPARETSGDFYDVFPLPQGHYGILIGDVVDKGVGAALFMALCWALLHTYARRYPTEPGKVLAATNRRILDDTHAGQFVTVFYGALDAASGKLLYANAGHPPPYHCHAGRLSCLMKTGIPLGILADGIWQEQAASFQPDDLCLLYTDGVTEGQNGNGDFFEAARVEKVLYEQAEGSAGDVKGTLLAELERFTGPGAPSDDITLIVLAHTGGSVPTRRLIVSNPSGIELE